MSNLDRIGISTHTDKSSLIHNYCVKYEKYLPFNQYDKITILEIGVLNGESLKMWKEYFYNSKIIGIDINSDCDKYIEERISIEIGSQTDGDFLEKLHEDYGRFDMILDDGSHNNSDVIFTFEKLFPYLKSGGVYIVEDSCTSYWSKYDGEYLKKGTMMEYFKGLTDDVSFRGLEIPGDSLKAWYRKEDGLIDVSKQIQPECRVDIESINFLNSIILITKR